MPLFIAGQNDAKRPALTSAPTSAANCGDAVGSPPIGGNAGTVALGAKPERSPAVAGEMAQHCRRQYHSKTGRIGGAVGPVPRDYYMASAAEGSSPARLLGVYEATLHPVIEDICTCDYAQIIDVGCAEGYYAVGLARRLPAARVFARDSNPIAREKCAQLAALNGVAGQWTLAGAVAHGFLRYLLLVQKTLVILRY
ncbi:MAG: class I SAM-dependent methyltransferase [Cypionkella sp.]|nr:class I SAM-dependent methyltransferase [Cypionkella sp.]